MITRKILLSAILLSSASVASAQTVGGPQPAAQPQSQPLGGPVIDGICLLSREAIFANAAVGRAASARLQRQEALAQRWQALQQSAAHSSREIDATRTSVMSRIATEAQPVIAEVYQQKNCGLLFDRNSALGGNFANDLTADVVTALDARIQTITFERERLPQQSEQSGADTAVR